MAAKCSDCATPVVVGVAFEVTVPVNVITGETRVVRWRLCRRCFIAARATEVANG